MCINCEYNEIMILHKGIRTFLIKGYKTMKK